VKFENFEFEISISENENIKFSLILSNYELLI